MEKIGTKRARGLIKRISITGPESTGKSVLAGQLAAYFHEPYVPEYARSYLQNKGASYTLADVENIARGQLESEEQKAREANRLLFCDTDPLVIKIWCSVRFGKVPPRIEEQFINHRYDLYLLCYPDIPWEADPLRENPHDRDQLFRLYEKELKQAGFNYRIVSGLGAQRLEKAVTFVQQIAKF